MPAPAAARMRCSRRTRAARDVAAHLPARHAGAARGRRASLRIPHLRRPASRPRRRDRAAGGRRAGAADLGRAAGPRTRGAELRHRCPALAEQLGALVDAMRTRGALPAGAAPIRRRPHARAPEQRDLRLPRAPAPGPGGRVRVRVHNRDGFAHRVTARRCTGAGRPAARTTGALRLDAAATGQRISAGASAMVELACPPTPSRCGSATPTRATRPPPGRARAGPRGRRRSPPGDAAGRAVAPGHGRAGRPLAHALGHRRRHAALAGADLERSPRTVHLIPGGRHTATSAAAPLEPSDIAVDHRGVVWTTLLLGNGIARLDPAGSPTARPPACRVYSLPACDDEECPAIFPPDPGARPTRQPLQIEVSEDADGNTLVWFTEANVDRIGLLRVAPDGTQLGQTHFSCGCRVPLGLALDQAGDVWFTEAVDNRLGRLTLDVTEPFAAAAARLRHYRIPSAELVDEPELAPAPVLDLEPAQRGGRPPRARVVHGEPRRQARLSRPRARAAGHDGGHDGDRAPHDRVRHRRRTRRPRRSTAPGRCSGPTSTATSWAAS